MSNSSNLFGGGFGGFGAGLRPDAANNGFGSGSRPDTTKNGFGMASRPAPAKNLFGDSGSAPTLFGASAVPAHSINKAEAEASLALTKSEPEPVKPHRQVTHFDPTSPIVTVKVGTSETGIATFYVHHEVLRRSSKFLQAKCEDVWSKSNSTIEISNHSSNTFALYVNWAYSGLISLDEQKKKLLPENQAQSDAKPVKQNEQPEVASEKSQIEPDTKSSAADKQLEEAPAKSQSEHITKENDWIILAKAYVLGDELVDAKFQNDILATMKFKQWSVDTKTLGPLMGELSSIIYSGTTEGSDARQFLVDLFSARVTKAELISKKGTLTPDFVFDVLLAKVPAWS